MKAKPDAGTRVLPQSAPRALLAFPSVRNVALALAFWAAYLLLDRLSYIHPMQALGITPWNPQPALAIALIFLRGQRWLGAVFGAIFSAEVIVRNAPFPWTTALVVAGVLTLAYAAVARAMAAPFDIRQSLDDRRDVVRLIIVVVIGAFVTAVLYVASLTALGTRFDEGIAIAALKFWIGDSVGILVTLPLVFMLVEPTRRSALKHFFRKGEAIAQFAAIAAALWIVFGEFGGQPFKYFYLLFLPLVWTAARNGLSGAVLSVAVIQSGIIVAVQSGGAPAITVFELQALQIALTITGFFLGVTVDERERASHALRQSSRLAAAGSMAGALAHELNQPLTALSGYAKASQLLLATRPVDIARLDETLKRIVAETHRAASVVLKVREFFQAGTPQRTQSDLAALVHDAVESLRTRAAAEEVQIELDVEGALPLLQIDPIQIQVVLRNLLLNAIESATERQTEERHILLKLELPESGTARLTVQDSGPGVTADLVEKIFEPFYTSKATGMGMGLAISRAIVQAHGGALRAVAGSFGCFELYLPVPKRPV